jgi:hypothetical protein
VETGGLWGWYRVTVEEGDRHFAPATAPIFSTRDGKMRAAAFTIEAAEGWLWGLIVLKLEVADPVLSKYWIALKCSRIVNSAEDEAVS